MVLLSYGCLDSLTCTAMPGSSMNWQAVRDKLHNMLVLQPFSTLCRI